MRKIAVLCLCGATALTMLTGCSTGEATTADLGKVTLGEYKGVKVNVPAPEVTDEEVENAVQSDLDANPEYVEVDRPAKEGDTVNIDYKGTKDGEAFDGGTAEGQDLELGSGRMIDGFEDGLIGASKGETKSLNLTFPEDYREESLAGQAVVFEVTVNSVKEKHDAVLNDAFVQRVSSYQTVDEYKEGLRQNLLDQKQNQAEQQMEQAALESVIENSQFKLSRNGLSKRYNQSLKQYEAQAKMYGTTLSQMAQANGMDVPALKESIYASVEEEAKMELVVDAIATSEGITVTDAEKETFAQENGFTAESLTDMYGEDSVNEMTKNYLVLQYLGVNADNEAENPAVVTVPETTAAEETSEETAESAESESETAASEAAETSSEAESAEEETTAAE